MRLLIGGSTSKFFHLKEFSEQLKKNGADCKLVIDTEIYAGFPSKKISSWFEVLGDWAITACVLAGIHKKNPELAEQLKNA